MPPGTDSAPEPIRRRAEALGTGVWEADDLLLVPPGSWTVRIDALVSDFEKTGFETVVPLR